MKGTKEFYDLMDSFERLGLYNVYVSGEVKRASKEVMGKYRNVYYDNGEVNKLFLVYMNGYANGKATYLNNN